MCCFNDGDYCDPKCSALGVMSHNKALKCYTIFSKLSKNFNINNLNEISNIKNAHFMFWGKIILFIHDSNQLPTFIDMKLFPILIEGRDPLYHYEKTLFERLPPPYETNCQYYSGRIRSQSQCLNELLFEEFLKKRCLSKSDRNIAYVIDNNDYSKFKYKICDNFTQEIGNHFLNKWNPRCRESCFEELYEIWESERDSRGWCE
jgi:hypothetical protein